MVEITTLDELRVLKYQLLEIEEELNKILVQLRTMKSSEVKRKVREARRNAGTIYKELEELDNYFVSSKKEEKALYSAYNAYNRVIDLSFNIEKKLAATPSPKKPKPKAKSPKPTPASPKKSPPKAKPTPKKSPSPKKPKPKVKSPKPTPPKSPSPTEDEIIRDFASLLLAKEKLRNAYVDKVAKEIASSSSTRAELEKKIDAELSKKRYAPFKVLNRSLREDMLLLAREEEIVKNYASLISSKNASDISQYERKLIQEMKGKRFFDRLYYKLRTKTGIAVRILVPGALIAGSVLTGGLLASAMLAAGGSLLVASRFVSAYAGYQALHHAIQGRKKFRKDPDKLSYSVGVNVMYNREKAVSDKKLQKVVGKGVINDINARVLSESHVKAAKNMRRNRVAATLIAGTLAFVGFTRAYEHVKNVASYAGRGLKSVYHFIMPDSWEHKISEAYHKIVGKASEVVSPVVEKTKEVTEPIVKKTKEVVGSDKHKPGVGRSDPGDMPKAKGPTENLVPQPTPSVDAIEVVVSKNEGISHTAYKAIEEYFSTSQDELQQIADKLGTTTTAVKNALAEKLTHAQLEALGGPVVHPGQKLVYTHDQIGKALRQISEENLKDLKQEWRNFVHRFGIKQPDGVVPLEKFKPKLRR